MTYREVLRNSLQRSCSELCHLLAPEHWKSRVDCKSRFWISVWSVVWLHLYPWYTVRLYPLKYLVGIGIFIEGGGEGEWAWGRDWLCLCSSEQMLTCSWEAGLGKKCGFLRHEVLILEPGKDFSRKEELESSDAGCPAQPQTPQWAAVTQVLVSLGLAVKVFVCFCSFLKIYLICNRITFLLGALSGFRI